MPSLKDAVAVNCTSTPGFAIGIAGVTIIETGAADVTLEAVDPDTVPTPAVTVVLPVPIPVARLCVFIETTVGSAALQDAMFVKSSVLPSE